MIRFINILILSLLSLSLWAQDIEYSLTGNKTYEIAGIAVEGADSYEDFVLIGFSGLAVGDKVEVPGPQITKAVKRFWKQGLFSNVQIKADRIEGNKIWLVIALEQRPRVSEVRYDGLKKSEREDVEVKAGISLNDKVCFPYGKDVKEGVKTRETDTVIYPEGGMG